MPDQQKTPNTYTPLVITVLTGLGAATIALALAADHMSNKASCPTGTEPMGEQCVDTACYAREMESGRSPDPNRQTVVNALSAAAKFEGRPAGYFNLEAAGHWIKEARTRDLCKVGAMNHNTSLFENETTGGNLASAGGVEPPL